MPTDIKRDRCVLRVPRASAGPLERYRHRKLRGATRLRRTQEESQPVHRETFHSGT